MKLVRRSTRAHIDGVNLEHFFVGTRYDVGATLGALLLAEAWAARVTDQGGRPVRDVTDET